MSSTNNPFGDGQACKRILSNIKNLFNQNNEKFKND